MRRSLAYDTLSYAAASPARANAPRSNSNHMGFPLGIRTRVFQRMLLALLPLHFRTKCRRRTADGLVLAPFPGTRRSGGSNVGRKRRFPFVPEPVGRASARDWDHKRSRFSNLQTPLPAPSIVQTFRALCGSHGFALSLGFTREQALLDPATPRSSVDFPRLTRPDRGCPHLLRLTGRRSAGIQLAMHRRLCNRMR